MTITSPVELNDSWKFRETAEGQEFVRIFYAPWADVFSIGGASATLPAIGDPMPSTVMADRPDLKVIYITADPQMEDLVACRVEITYSNVTKETYPKKVPESMLSWEERFYTIPKIIEVDQYYSTPSDPGATPLEARYTGGEFTATHLKDVKGNIIPKPIQLSNLVYEKTVRLAALNVNFFINLLNHVNKDSIWSQRPLGTGGTAYRDKTGTLIMDGTDQLMWLFNDFSISKEGIGIYAVRMEFLYNPQGWNDQTRDGGLFYPQAALAPLMQLASLERPPISLTGSLR